MAIDKTWPNNTPSSTAPVGYSLPQTGDTSWGNLTLFLEALAENAQSTSAQRFGITLQADLADLDPDTQCVVITQLPVIYGAGTHDITVGPITGNNLLIVTNYNADPAAVISLTGTAPDSMYPVNPVLLNHGTTIVMIGSLIDNRWYKLVQT